MPLKEKNKESIKVIFWEQTEAMYVHAFQELAAVFFFPSGVPAADLILLRKVDPSLQQEFPLKQPPHSPPSLRNHNSSLNTLERNSIFLQQRKTDAQTLEQSNFRPFRQYAGSLRAFI